MPNEVSIGVIGCGDHCRGQLIPSLLQIRGARVAVICDSHDENLRAAAALVPAAVAIADSDAVLERVDLDAVVVVGPPQLHFRVAKLAISNGKHVFVEKPPTVSTPELLELSALARNRSVITCVGHNLRYAEAVRTMRDAMDRCGRPVFLSIYYVASAPLGTRWGLTSPLRSLLLSHGIHAIDLSNVLLGAPQSVSTRAVVTGRGGMTVSLLIGYENKAVGSIGISTNGCQFQFEARALFENGAMINLDALRRVAVYTPDGRGRRWSEVWEPKTLVTGYGLAGYLYELEAFVRAIQTGEHGSPSLSDEVATYRLVDEIEDQILRGDMGTAAGQETLIP